MTTHTTYVNTTCAFTTPSDIARRAKPVFAYVLIMWDKKARVVSREPGNDLRSLYAHAVAMCAEGSAATFQVFNTVL